MIINILGNPHYIYYIIVIRFHLILDCCEPETYSLFRDLQVRLSKNESNDHTFTH